MVIDDSLESLSLLTQVLSSAGYDVRPSDGAELALASIAARPPDLVLTDLRMPDMDGFEVCRRLREGFPDVPVIIISVAGETSERVRGLKLGAVDFVTKPFSAEELLARVRIHLDLCLARRELQGQAVSLQRVNEELRGQVSERLRVEDALRASEERYRGLFREESAAYEGLFANVPDGCALHEIILDPSGEPVDYRFLAVNAAFERLTGLPAESVVGHTVLELLGSGGLDLVHAFGPVVLTGEPVVVERGSEARDRVFRIQAYRSRPGRFVTLFSDVTQQRLLEVRLRQSEKMTAIGHLAGGVAHDFNNQLTAALGYADLLVGKLDEPCLRRYAENVVTASRRMADLTQKLLAYAQQGQYRKEPVSVCRLVRETVYMLQQSVDPLIRIGQEHAARSDVVLGDPTQLQDVLLNLAFNAYDAMPGGGALVFETADVRLGPSEDGPLASLPAGDYVVVTVKDTGCGMSDEVKDRVFEPFFSTKQHVTGTGMSLPAVYGTVVHHGGAITVDSEVGRGTALTVYLPLAASKEEGLSGRVAPASPSRPLCVLAVDDEEMVRELLSDILVGAGHRVITASDGREALEVFREHWPVIDLVILDMVMPHLDGRQTFQAMQATHPQVRVLLASGYSVEKMELEMREDGVLGFVQKPFEENTLLNKVREVLDA